MSQETDQPNGDEGEEKKFSLFRKNEHRYQPKTLPATPTEDEIPETYRRKTRRRKTSNELTEQRQQKHKKKWKNNEEESNEGE